MRKNKQDTPSGFDSYVVSDSLSYSDFSLLLPIKLIQKIKLERALAEEAEKSAQEPPVDSSSKKSTESSVYRSRPNSGVTEFDIESETESLLKTASKEPSSAHFIPAYDVLEPLKLLTAAKGKTPDKDIHRRNESLYKQLKLKGNHRELAIPADDCTGFEHLRRCFPHFMPVLDLVQDQYNFAKHSGKPFSIPPILLGGSPGIGKTRFTQDLAKMLGTEIRRHAFDNNQSGSSLLGSDRHWANTSYGLVFELVALGSFANPVVLLDEIDKASRRDGIDPLASLHSLLEPVTSQKVRDLSVELEINASHVIWIATANDLGRIPESLRSRFQVFLIEHPTGEQSIQMSEVIAKEIHKEMNLPEFQEPSKELVHFISHLSAREQTQALKRAYACAIASGRKHLEKHDLPEDVRREAYEFSGDVDPTVGTLH